MISALCLVGIPFASFASTSPDGGVVLAGDGIVNTVYVGLTDGTNNCVSVTLIKNGTVSARKVLTSNQAKTSYSPSILSLLMYSKAAGSLISLYNHTNADANQFDEVAIEAN